MNWKKGSKNRDERKTVTENYRSRAPSVITEQKKSRLPAAVCVGVSVLLWLYLSFWGKGADPKLSEGLLAREGYGGSSREEELLVYGLDEKEQALTVQVSPRVYTKEEADDVFDAAMEQLGEQILGENESLKAVTSDLILPTYLKESGVQIRWHSSEPDSLSSSGTIMTEVLKKQELLLQAELRTGDYRADYEIPVTLVPKPRSQEQELLRSLTDEVIRLDEEQKNEEYLKLPTEYQGKALSYRTAEKQNYSGILLMGAALAAILFLREDSKRKEQEKKREQMLLLDYAEVVSKLQVLVGAGMTVRNAWGRMVHDYEAAEFRKKRPAYEEMRQTYYQMENGTAEGVSFREFGRRCRLQPYLKLSSILEQNRKTGTKNLRELLRTEVEDAFEMRKNLARRMGEEAGTKLLIPLFMLLFIVMVFIMVPAMMTMG